jgi:hypothetical protein
MDCDNTTKSHIQKTRNSNLQQTSQFQLNELSKSTTTYPKIMNRTSKCNTSQPMQQTRLLRSHGQRGKVGYQRQHGVRHLHKRLNEPAVQEGKQNTIDLSQD